MNMTAGKLVRDQRERRGLSQAQVAEEAGFSKHLLSMIESGKRAPTEEQVEALSASLGIPAELLRIGSGRLPPDIQNALESDTASVVAAVRQHREAHAITFPSCPAKLPTASDSRGAKKGAEQIPEWIHVSKATTSYRAHSYHTKVPPEAIAPFIRALTSPGDTVLDPFCGSGMTGVAALMEGRHALLSDLSPAAVHIATNYTTPCDPTELLEAFKKVEAAVRPTIDWLYRCSHSNRVVEYTTWSDMYQCRSCSGQFLYWDAVHSGSVEADRIRCSKCGLRQRKSELQWVGEAPVQSHTSSGSNRIDSHPPTAEELALIATSDASSIPYWVPSVDFTEGREMWRAAHRAMGISDVSAFFTKRNLHALSALRHVIVECADGRIREALMFAFTACVNRASKRYQWNAKRPTNVMTGTLYISSLRYEWNVWSLFRRKFADVLKHYRQFPEHPSAQCQVFQRSATDLSCIPDGAVDLVFMDPPFGSNIFYADSSLLWDAWLGTMTDQRAEIVVNRHRSKSDGGKDIAEYRDLMAGAFSEARRVLKTSGYAVLAFSNSDDEVWKSVQDALSQAGLDVLRVHVLNKGQPSIKGVKGHSGEQNVTTFDLLLVLKPKASDLPSRSSESSTASTAKRVIPELLLSSPAGCRTDEVYSAVVRAVLEQGGSLIGVTMPSIERMCTEVGASLEDGRWVMLPASLECAPHSLQKGALLLEYLRHPVDIPLSNGSPATSKPIGVVTVPATRNTALYTAHSYHTKVPPEAIAPFIEHYTKRGDVVLDPFCGSGMTGVAASQCGRRSILNDLAPAAVHLAWNHTRPCDPEALQAAFERLERAVTPLFKDLYRVQHTDGSEGMIVWTLWSSRYRCARCPHTFLLWEVVDRDSGRVGATVNCPSCQATLKRSQLVRIGSEPAWLSYDVEGNRHERAPTPSEVRRAQSFRKADIPFWYPDIVLDKASEMYVRCALHLQEIESITDFYTARNLYALAALWHHINQEEDVRARAALAFAFTNTAWHGTRMRRFNARGGQRPLTGTLYVPQLSSEANVLEVMRNKIAQLRRYYHSYRPIGDIMPKVLLGSAASIRDLQDESVDYIFTDPPFGSNIFYADCNAIWEAWLGQMTVQAEEAVVNRSRAPSAGGKTLSEYSAIMDRALSEMYRVLKKGAWATVVFHNTDAKVWSAIHVAAEKAGFEFHDAVSLDRKQQSHKGYKGRSGQEDVAHFDVVFNLRKPIKTAADKRKRQDYPTVREIIRSIVEDAEIASKGLQGVHSELMRQLASRGEAIYVDYAEVRALWAEALKG